LEADLCLQSYFDKWQLKEITDGEMALAFFLIAHNEIYPQKRLTALIEKNQLSASLLKTLQFKKIKNKALTCLSKWLSGEWACLLTEKILSPESILHFQAKGLRPVTMKLKNREKSILHRENALDFFCHDLEHGYMFFHNPEWTKMQLEFFQKMEKSLKAGEWDELLLDEEFKKKFHYAISDMNTHQAHYQAYLMAMIPPDQTLKYQNFFT